uniref:Carboxylesterase type B domain-containing protein n=1 Tax=Timema tahoe TaxID=61484 RepID=A0A7R9IIA3_9NEOP|nr:unnamed protein product [Timema tahoe]
MDVHGAILLILASNFDITVTVAQGVLRGQSVTSSYGLTYNRFLGIPYAQPPVGDLRFKLIACLPIELKVQGSIPGMAEQFIMSEMWVWITPFAVMNSRSGGWMLCLF